MDATKQQASDMPANGASSVANFFDAMIQPGLLAIARGQCGASFLSLMGFLAGWFSVWRILRMA